MNARDGDSAARTKMDNLGFVGRHHPPIRTYPVQLSRSLEEARSIVEIGGENEDESSKEGEEIEETVFLVPARLRRSTSCGGGLRVTSNTATA